MRQVSARRFFDDFRVRIALAATGIAVAASILLSALSVVRTISFAEGNLRARADELAEWLSNQVAPGVQAGSRRQVESQVQRFLRLQDVAGAVVLRDGEPFVALGRIPPSLGESAEGTIDESSVEVSRAAIVLEPGASTAEGVGGSAGPQMLGTVAIVLARTRLRESVDHFVALSTLMTLGVIGLALAASALTARRIAAPVQRLISAAEQIGSGKHAVQVPVESADAIGRLSSTFNRMAADVQRSSEEMERRVDERTQELSAAVQELEAFSYSVSHDLRAPLRHLAGFAEILRAREGPGLNPEAQRYLTIISDAAKRMGSLIDDLLILLRIGRAPVRKTRVNLRSLVEEVRLGLSPEYEKRAVEWILGDLPEVCGDPSLLRALMTNLLGNALKYTRSRSPARIEVGCEPREREVVCFVRDNGVGFDMQFVDKLFGPFQRLHSSEEFEGTGIGLAIARRIVERHGGKTWAEGELGKGATLFFSLPK
jgi:signal transduction histidine kinase